MRATSRAPGTPFTNSVRCARWSRVRGPIRSGLPGRRMTGARRGSTWTRLGVCSTHRCPRRGRQWTWPKPEGGGETPAAPARRWRPGLPTLHSALRAAPEAGAAGTDRQGGGDPRRGRQEGVSARIAPAVRGVALPAAVCVPPHAAIEVAPAGAVSRPIRQHASPPGERSHPHARTRPAGPRGAAPGAWSGDRWHQSPWLRSCR